MPTRCRRQRARRTRCRSRRRRSRSDAGSRCWRRCARAAPAIAAERGSATHAQSLWQRIGDFAAGRPGSVLAGVAAATAVFAFGLLRVEVDTSFLSFVSEPTRKLVPAIEDDFAEGSYLTLIFE